MSELVLRKLQYRLYPTPGQERLMFGMLGLHQRLYNAALEQRVTAWKRCGKKLSWVDQHRDLTELRASYPEYAGLNCGSERVTLNRLDEAYGAFFRRLKAGLTAGFPRFKSFNRFPGWGYQKQGYKLLPGVGNKHGRLQLTGIGKIRMRGRPKSIGEVRSCEISRKGDKWYASISVRREADRKGGPDVIAFDWGVETFATLAIQVGDRPISPDDSGQFTRVLTVSNPRFFAKHKDSITRAARRLDVVTKKDLIGRPINWDDPLRIAAKVALQRACAKASNGRKDFLHKTSAMFVAMASVIATEKLTISNMTRSAKGAQKAGLNREILATAPAMFLSMLRYKAEEAGIVYLEAPTRMLKPSQRCSDCGVVVKKQLSEREHRCPCGCVMSRDENAAKVILKWVLKEAGPGPASSAADAA